MSTSKEIKKKKSGSKKGLGRGLKSLLPTKNFRFEKSFAEDQKDFVEKEVFDYTVDFRDSLVISPGKQKETTSLKPSKEDVLKHEKLSHNNRLNNNSFKTFNLAIEKLTPSKTQPRKDFLKEALKELSLSIEKQGLLQPIIVRKMKEKFEIIAGERRWRASQMAGLKEVPVILRENVDSQRSTELALIENLQREDLNILEEAMGYQLLMDEYHLSQKDLALRLGKKRSSIANALRILILPEDVKKMLKQGFLNLGHAKVLLSINDFKKQSQLARKVVEKKLSVRSLEKEIRKEKNGEKEINLCGETVNEWTCELAAGLQKILGTKVNIHYKKGRGQVNIAFYSDDELSQFCEKIKNRWLQF